MFLKNPAPSKKGSTELGMPPFLVNMLARPCEGVLPSNDTAFWALCDNLWNERKSESRQNRSGSQRRKIV